MLRTPRKAVAAIAALTALSFTVYLPVVAPTMAASLLSDDDDDDDDEPCMTSHRMRQFLSAKGYTNIKLNSPIGSNWQAKATQDGRVFLIVVDTCSSRIRQRSPLGSN